MEHTKRDNQSDVESRRNGRRALTTTPVLPSPQTPVASLLDPLLFDHGTADYDASVGVGTNILKLVSASADHEVAAMVQKSHGASTVRIHGIGPGEILTPTVIQYDAATEVEDSARRETARAIERIQARLVHWPIGAYARGYVWWWPGWKKARKRVGVTAVEATQIIGLGARQGDLHDQCNYPQRQNRPEEPGLRQLGNASCELDVLIFHKLISFSCFGLF